MLDVKIYDNNFYDNNKDYNIAKNNLSDNTSSNKLKENKNIINKNPRAIWGAVVTQLHKQNLMALFTACGEIRDIKLEENTLVINIREEFLYNILTKEENLYKITTLLKQINNSLELKFNLIKKKDDNILLNIKRLEEIFGKDLEIKK